MTHESFNDSKNKIRKNFEKSKQNTADLNQKKNVILNFFTEKGKIAVNRTIHDSGFIAKKPTKNTSIVRDKSGELLSEFVTFDYEADIEEIPEDLLPFVDINLSVKTVPNVDATGFLEHPISVVQDERVIVKGDGNLIYQGNIPKAVKRIHSQTDLDAGNFQQSFTKNVFTGEIIYTFGGDKFKITGIVFQITFTDRLGTLGSGCVSGQEDTDFFRTQIDQFLSNFKNYAQFNTLTSTQVNMTHLKQEIRANDFPDCFGSVTTDFDDETATFIFSNFTGSDSHVISLQNGILFKEIDGEFVQQAVGNFSFDSLIHTLVSQDFTFQGFWLFYSEDTFFFFGIDDVIPSETEGDFDKIELKNLPESPNRPYTNITLVRNPEGFPATEDINTIRVGSRQEKYFKLEERSNGINKYRLILSDILILSANSSENSSDDASLEVPVYNDIYTQVGDTYELTTEDHTLKDLLLFEADNQDVEFRVKLELKNPFYWEEIRNIE